FLSLSGRNTDKNVSDYRVWQIGGMTGIQPELWVDEASKAVAFYRAAFGADVLHLVGEGDDIVAQLAAGGAAFWVSAASSDAGRVGGGVVEARGHQRQHREDLAGGRRPGRVRRGRGRCWGRSARRGERRARLASGTDHRPLRP